MHDQEKDGKTKLEEPQKAFGLQPLHNPFSLFCKYRTFIYQIMVSAKIL
jgi:hypothetical protein